MLRLSHELTLPKEAVTQTFAFLGKRGGGKTYAAGKLAEEMLTHGAQAIVLDVVGNWYGLRIPKDKRNAPFNIVIFGGRNGDVPINPKAGKIVAGVILEKNLSAVIDISEFIHSEQTRFTYDFLAELFEYRKAHPAACHLVFEEAQELVPQNAPPKSGGDNYAARLMHIGNRVVKLGRNFGIGCSLISQRPQEVNKKVLDMCEVVLSFQMTGLSPRKTVTDLAKDEGIDIDINALLPKLEIGQAFVWSPSWLRISGVYKIGEKLTADVSATPTFGAGAGETQTLAPIDVKELSESIEALTVEAEANTPVALKKRIAELQKEIYELRIADNSNEPAVEVVKEVPVLDKAALAEVVKAVEAYQAAQSERIATFLGSITDAVAVFGDATPTGRIYDRLSELMNKAPELPGARTSTSFEVSKSATHMTDRGKSRAIVTKPPKSTSSVNSHATSNGAISRPQQKLLDVLASFEPLGLDCLSRSNLAVFADVSPKSSAFQNNLGTLRNASGALGDGPLVEYLSGGRVRLTDLGRALADGSEFSASSNADLLEAWCRKLSGPQERILRALFKKHPQAPTRPDLADAAGASPTSSAFQNNLGSLRSLSLIEYGSSDGQRTVFLTDLLFPFG